MNKLDNIDQFKQLHEFAQIPECPIVYIPKFREYGLKILDGSSSFLAIEYCPFTGKKLPEGLRDQWFDALDAMGLEPDSPDLPEKYKTDEWWIENEASLS